MVNHKRKRGETALWILITIFDYVSENGYPPTVREIGEEVDIASTSTVKEHIDRLDKAGFIRREKRKPRAIQVTEKGQELIAKNKDEALKAMMQA